MAELLDKVSVKSYINVWDGCLPSFYFFLLYMHNEVILINVIEFNKLLSDGLNLSRGAVCMCV